MLHSRKVVRWYAFITAIHKERSYQHFGLQTGGENKLGDLGPSPGVGKNLFEKRCARKHEPNSLVNLFLWLTWFAFSVNQGNSVLRGLRREESA
jgi:hypothetical protein